MSSLWSRVVRRSENPDPELAPNAGGSNQVAASELRDYLDTRDERRRIFPKAVLVGFAAGFVAVAFRAALLGADALRDALVNWSHRFGALGWIFPILFSVVGTISALFIVLFWSPSVSGSGIPHLEAVLHRHRVMNWSRVLFAKFIGGVLAIGSGLALGREGPTVQMGGAAGMGVAKLLKSSSRDSRTLTAAGAGAGLAAAFNAPLSGLIFVLEELQRDFRPTIFGAAFVAAVCADVVTRLFAGPLPSFAVPAYPSPPLELLPAFAVMGIVLGGFGVVYNRFLLFVVGKFGKLSKVRVLLWGAAVGAAVGLTAYLSPQVVGGGHSLAETALSGRLALAALPALILVRFLLSTLSYGTGAPGGIFAPLLALGALVGLVFGHLAVMLLPGTTIQPGAFAVVGMAAYFTAIVRAPLTGIVLIVEMTQSYAQMLPLLCACFFAYLAAEALRDMPIYEALLQRDLQKIGTPHVLTETMVLELEVRREASFVGKMVKELGLPPGIVLVGCRMGDQEWVPKADTLVTEGLRITAIIAADSSDGLELFREGCESPRDLHAK